MPGMSRVQHVHTARTRTRSIACVRIPSTRCTCCTQLNLASLASYIRFEFRCIAKFIKKYYKFIKKYYNDKSLKGMLKLMTNSNNNAETIVTDTITLFFSYLLYIQNLRMYVYVYMCVALF